jgi:hypothetical protein
VEQYRAALRDMVMAVGVPWVEAEAAGRANGAEAYVSLATGQASCVNVPWVKLHVHCPNWCTAMSSQAVDLLLLGLHIDCHSVNLTTLLALTAVFF